MSVDNWTVCPKCKRSQDRSMEQAQQRLRDAYGNVSADNYLRLVEQAKQQPLPLDQTFQEDYEIGVIDEQLYISYSGSCRLCRFTVKFKTERSVFDNGD